MDWLSSTWGRAIIRKRGSVAQVWRARFGSTATPMPSRIKSTMASLEFSSRYSRGFACSRRSLFYASSGTGSTLHLAGAMFEKQAGVELVHVPYRGNGPALNDVMQDRKS